MGAAAVGGRVASVRGLQEPLRQLVERIRESVNAELEVSRRGLTFRTSDLHEKNNPFRRIAVWSALKLQTRKRHNTNNDDVSIYFFFFFNSLINHFVYRKKSKIKKKISIRMKKITSIAMHRMSFTLLYL